MNPYELKDLNSLWIDPYTGERKVVNTASDIEWFNYNFKNCLGYLTNLENNKEATIALIASA
jgi:hypothetical protein